MDNNQPEDEGVSVTFEVVEGEMEGGRHVPRRGVYLLPNLFTTAALFSGFYCVLAAMNGAYENAAIAVFIAGVLDGLDGRIARMTNTQSDFGAEYDSLSDVVAFGVAPAALSYSWSLSSLGKYGWMLAFIFVACAALRLARFNTQVDTTDKKFFIGLSSPVAAGLIAGFVWMGVEIGFAGPDVSVVLAVLIVSAALLMVSNLPYYSFKDLGASGRVPFAVILAAVGVFVLVFIDPPKVLLLMSLIYVVSGPVLAYRKK
ncbi:MAG: CDP-diacylglycerol--serine O-phosphatidyltransferase [Gammaproteobacteria bacterium]|nr:CDP-diacylglycerol--serine O-phosphatidyltransferase [Gammaproteobacteria bacterium]